MTFKKREEPERKARHTGNDVQKGMKLLPPDRRDPLMGDSFNSHMGQVMPLLIQDGLTLVGFL